MIEEAYWQDYFVKIKNLGTSVLITDLAQARLKISDGIQAVLQLLIDAKKEKRRIAFIGNGGSAGISSHMAIDFTKNAGISALSLTDGAALTCLGNDLGFESVFSYQIGHHLREADILIAISSSGQSADILQGISRARERGCRIITLTGFSVDNPARKMGDLNWYIDSDEYGYVEVSHLCICHALLDRFLENEKDSQQAGARKIK
jgi:D-sedoheptulose 7-phosphate isomerase